MVRIIFRPFLISTTLRSHRTQIAAGILAFAFVRWLSLLRYPGLIIETKSFTPRNMQRILRKPTFGWKNVYFPRCFKISRKVNIIIFSNSIKIACSLSEEQIKNMNKICVLRSWNKWITMHVPCLFAKVGPKWMQGFLLKTCWKWILTHFIRRCDFSDCLFVGSSLIFPFVFLPLGTDQIESAATAFRISFLQTPRISW